VGQRMMQPVLTWAARASGRMLADKVKLGPVRPAVQQLAGRATPMAPGLHRHLCRGRRDPLSKTFAHSIRPPHDKAHRVPTAR
jgi:hypothetical protein